MDKETLSNYGWIVILVLILAVMLALATPFGTFVADAVKATTAGFFSVNQNALGAAGININDIVFADCEHNYVSDVIVNCDTTGTINYTCDKCGDTYTETRETAKHTFDNASDMTCDKCNTTFTGYAFKASDYDAKMGTTTMTDTHVTIPETFEYNGRAYKVTSIADHGFAYDCKSLISVSVPDSVTRIGNYAFLYCSSLTDINIPDGVTIIGTSAFGHCISLRSAVIPDGVSSLSVTFDECTSLESVTIPKSITYMDGSTFDNCTNLKNVYISDIVAWCNINFGLNNSRHSNPLNYADNLYLNGTLVTDLVIPEGATTISQLAFNGGGSITSVVIPKGVTSIGYCSIAYNNSIKSITIPNTVTSIDACAFLFSSSLTDITFEGTIAQWNEITQNSLRKDGLAATQIQCSDGVISLR